jgi:Cu+-exporting ATPase
MFIKAPIFHNPYFQLILCLPVFIVGCLHFGKSALGGIRSGIANMDVLIMLGSSAAFFYSLVLTFINDQQHTSLFYETTATIITLVLLGNLIEQKSVKATTTAIDELSRMKVNNARKVQVHGAHEHILETAIENIVVGDLLLVNEGDKIPVDAIIEKGEANINESMISGESLAVMKGPGKNVIAGTLVEKGSLYIRATVIGEGTMLSRIIEMVKHAQRNKPGIQRLGDKVSGIFVPVVLAISFLTFIISYLIVGIPASTALMNSIAVLVISCPCAMGLATPTAVMAGIGRAAKNGILIKGGDTLEQLAGVDIIVFDKTGTLTTGNLKISELTLFNVTEEYALSLIYELEQKSSHPIARSIIASIGSKTTPANLTSITEVKGFGMQATDATSASIKFGSGNFINNQDKKFDLYLTRNDMLIAGLNISDELRPNVKEAIHSLIKSGVTPVLLSGDTREKCQKIANEIGIEKVYAEQLPEDKLKIIDKLVGSNKVAMVGDGINDAPALARAHVGISLNNSTDVAIHTSQVVILKTSDFNIITTAILLSRKTLLTIKQNLFWAFLYNVVAIPVAALGYLGEYGPMVGAISMAFSDVIVVGNSILLKFKRLG